MKKEEQREKKNLFINSINQVNNQQYLTVCFSADELPYKTYPKHNKKDCADFSVLTLTKQHYFEIYFKNHVK